MSVLDSLKVGDAVLVRQFCYGHLSYGTTYIEKITAYHFVTESGVKYRRTDGLAVGSEWLRRALEPFDAEIWEGELRARRGYELVKRLSGYTWTDLNLGELESINARLLELEKVKAQRKPMRDACSSL